MVAINLVVPMTKSSTVENIIAYGLHVHGLGKRAIIPILTETMKSRGVLEARNFGLPASCLVGGSMTDIWTTAKRHAASWIKTNNPAHPSLPVFEGKAPELQFMPEGVH